MIPSILKLLTLEKEGEDFAHGAQHLIKKQNFRFFAA
jgi:hypothetical protein